MRSISSALRDAQQSSSVEPYIRIVLTTPSGGYRDYTHRLTKLEHHEEPYNDWAYIFLYDNDRAIPELRGSWIEIGYGVFANGEIEYENTPRLWVKSTQLTSREGDLFMVLSCEGMWAHLEELDLITKGEPPYYQGQYDASDTIYDTISAILTSAGYTLEALGGADDGIIDTFTPQIWINLAPFENPADVLYRLIAMTKCYLRPLPSLKFEVVFPQDDDSVDITYNYDRKHYFHEYGEKLNCVIPNDIVVYGNAGTDDAWVPVVGEAKYDEGIVRCKHISPPDGKITRHHIAADISIQSDAVNRAEAILSKIKFEELSGRLVVPHDCRVELYDRIGVNDSR